ncbi:hypothetical protein Trydic_g7133 [Trypoxylus dichotomus]
MLNQIKKETILPQGIPSNRITKFIPLDIPSPFPSLHPVKVIPLVLMSKHGTPSVHPFIHQTSDLVDSVVMSPIYKHFFGVRRAYVESGVLTCRTSSGGDRAVPAPGGEYLERNQATPGQTVSSESLLRL